MAVEPATVALPVEDLPIVSSDSDESVEVEQYWITGYGADFDVEGLVRRLCCGDIEIPEFQRTYVWNQNRASRFIESLLIGLPVPGIFLYRAKGSQTLRVIDGQQRLLSLRFYYRGEFADTGREFVLQGLGSKSRFNGLKYKNLPAEDRRRLNDSIIHASIIQQNAPDDDGSSQFALFERLNTTSTPLSPHEIRAAIYGGAFNDLLAELNDCTEWRTLVGKPNRRKRDQELILRFFALYHDFAVYKRNMKSFLNDYMNDNRHLQRQSVDELRKLFRSTVTTVLEKLDRGALRPDRAVNAALTDALLVAIARRLERGPISANIRKEYDALMMDEAFVSSISAGTSQLNNVRTRIRLATEAFAGVE